MFRSAHIAGLHVHHHDRCRRRYSSFYPDILSVTPAPLHCYVCLARYDLSVGESPTRLTLSPAGSTGGGPGGNKWAEALPETASQGSQQVMRAVTCVNAEQASKCRRGCRHAIITGKADDDREESEECTGHTHRGSGDSTHND